ncbi:hypothetical protein BDV23DRAFT_39243 [Aspergillus alliaceus]|uniref:Uncharacterized protein n=1 Tax=Petromyces alliaceus TaxID=209559 RepID=A0A5N7BS04_PETAA|nr:hypothetical protein BDV23DRAFT_39243 [Aspergillus alliaceus]
MAITKTPWLRAWSAIDHRRLFCGQDKSNGTLPTILLNQGQGGLRPSDITFDTDSMTAFLSSLAAARRGIRWYPSQRPISDLQSGLHLDPLLVEYTDHHSGLCDGQSI